MNFFKIILAIVLLAILFFIIGRMLINSTIFITEWEPYISTWFRRFLRSLRTVLSYIWNKILKPFGKALIAALGAITKWVTAAWEKKQREKKIQEALEFIPILSDNLLDFFEGYPLPPDATPNLGMRLKIIYLGGNRYLIILFLKEPHILLPITIGRDICDVFNRNLEEIKKLLSRIYGPNAPYMFPGIYRIRIAIKASQHDPTTVEITIEVLL